MRLEPPIKGLINSCNYGEQKNKIFILFLSLISRISIHESFCYDETFAETKTPLVSQNKKLIATQNFGLRLFLGGIMRCAVDPRFGKNKIKPNW